jgi:hypothetical protein
VLQRNPHPYPVDIPAIPTTVQGGATVDWPDPIAGFEPADDTGGTIAELPAAPDEPEPPRAAKTTSKRAAAPTDATPKEQ